jgi:PhzF family phenazine biosynthesis protein
MKAQFFEGNAFTGTKDNPLQQMPIGNPALVCFSDVLFVDDDMSEIACLAQSPMTVFIAPGASADDYHVRYYSPNGLEVDLCGHATLVSAYFLKNFVRSAPAYNLKLNPAYLSGGNTLTGLAWDDGIGMQTKYFTSRKIDLTANIEAIAAALNVEVGDIAETYQTALNDIVFVLRDNVPLRKAHPDFQAIIDLGHTVLPHRTMVLSAASSESGFDYEARVFAPGIGVNEDIACGSVNCSLAPIWKDKVGKQIVRMFYCTPDAEDRVIVGGVQELSFHDGTITIRSNVRPAWHETLEVTDVSALLRDATFLKLMKEVGKASMIEEAEGFFDVTRTDATGADSEEYEEKKRSFG